MLRPAPVGWPSRVGMERAAETAGDYRLPTPPRCSPIRRSAPASVACSTSWRASTGYSGGMAAGAYDKVSNGRLVDGPSRMRDARRRARCPPKGLAAFTKSSAGPANWS